MSATQTLERVLRDDEDVSGQTVRSWLLTETGGSVQIARNERSDWLTIRVADVPQFVADLVKIAEGSEP